MLTDTKCRNARPKAKLYRMTDQRGLVLEVKPNGAKAWRYRFKLPDAEGNLKESMFGLGDYTPAPAGETEDEAKARRAGQMLTLAEARDAHLKARALVKQGINPSLYRQQEQKKRVLDLANTFEAVAHEWLALKDWEEVTKARRLDMLKRVVFPTLGQLPVKQITPPLILQILKATAERRHDKKGHRIGGPAVMADAKRTMYGVFELAAETFRVDANPVHQWREALPKNKTQHKRPLEINEVGQLLRDVDGWGGRHETITPFRLMWLTLVRPNEACGARWSEFDLNAALWKIPAERMKMRVEHWVPLPRQAVEMMRAMKHITGRYEVCFPHRDDRTKPMEINTLRAMLNSLGWGGKYSPHATRTTGSTRLNEMGYRAEVIERQLAHVERNAVRRTYNHAEYMAERITMMQQWADMLDTWQAGNAGKVVPLRAVG